MIGKTSPAAHTLPLISPESFPPRANDDPSRTTPTSNGFHNPAGPEFNQREKKEDEISMTPNRFHNPAGPEFNQHEKKVDESSIDYMPPKTINH